MYAETRVYTPGASWVLLVQPFPQEVTPYKYCQELAMQTNGPPESPANVHNFLITLQFLVGNEWHLACSWLVLILALTTVLPIPTSTNYHFICKLVWPNGSFVVRLKIRIRPAVTSQLSLTRKIGVPARSGTNKVVTNLVASQLGVYMQSSYHCVLR